MELILLLATLFLGATGEIAPEPDSPLLIGMQERAAEARTDSSTSDADLPFLQVLALFGIMVGGGGMMWWIQRRRASVRIPGQGDDSIQIMETKSMGGRQFLVVVAHGDGRSLLGVGPGFVNFLRDLPRKKESAQIPAGEDDTAKGPPPRKRFAALMAEEEDLP